MVLRASIFGRPFFEVFFGWLGIVVADVDGVGIRRMERHCVTFFRMTEFAEISIVGIESTIVTLGGIDVDDVVAMLERFFCGRFVGTFATIAGPIGQDEWISAVDNTKNATRIDNPGPSVTPER